MRLHTVFITYNRLDLTKISVESYLETVTVPHTISIVDNHSEDGTQDWIMSKADLFYSHHLLRENRYPGFACNLGFSRAPREATFLQRADNDFRFLPDWCAEVKRRFVDPKIGQLGLRTPPEEQWASNNVGGNSIFRRELWDQGLRYEEKPWSEYPPGWSEDSLISPEVKKMGYEWRRVKRPCIESLASGDLNDPYYVKSYGDRGIIDPKVHGMRLGIVRDPD